MSYVALATITLGGTDAEVIFGSIPNTYRDLVLVWSGTTSANTDIVVSVNTDTTNTYPIVQMFGVGSGSGTSAAFTRTGAYLAFGTSTLGSAVMSIMDYSATDKHKTFLARYNTSEVSAQASRWASNNAINTVAVRSTGGNMNSGTTISLYGIRS